MSGSLMQVNLDQPAQERGAFNVSLTSKKSANYTNLRLLTPENSKKAGDKVLYGDFMIIQEDSTK